MSESDCENEGLRAVAVRTTPTCAIFTFFASVDVSTHAGLVGAVRSVCVCVCVCKRVQVHPNLLSTRN